MSIILNQIRLEPSSVVAGGSAIPYFTREQFERAKNGRQKTNDLVEGRHNVFQMRLGYAHPTIGKLSSSFEKNKVCRRTNWLEKMRRKWPQGDKIRKSHASLVENLKRFNNNIFLKQLEGLACNFDF